MTSYAFSCVVDNVPALMAQAFIWVNCLKRLQSIEPSDIYVHLVDVQNREFLDWLEAEQVNVVAVERFDQRSPHCNKIQQLHTFAGTDYDQIVLMDCDTAWVGQRFTASLLSIGLMRQVFYFFTAKSHRDRSAGEIQYAYLQW